MQKPLDKILASTKNHYSFYCVAANGKVISRNENDLVETASTRKLLIMSYAFHLAEQGKLDLNKAVKVYNKDIGGLGSGIMPVFSLKQKIELHNLIVLMMTVSDNTATNVLVRILGRENIDDYAQSIGLQHTKLEMGFLSFDYSYRLGKPKVGTSTAKEMATLVDKIVNGKIHNKTYTKKAEQIMRNIHNSRAKKYLPYSLDRKGIQDFGSKTGGVIDETGSYLFGEVGFVSDKHGRRHIFSIFGTGKLTGDLPLSLDSENSREFSELAAALYYKLEKSE